MVFGRVIAATAARTMLELPAGQCPKCACKKVVPKEKLTTVVSRERCGAGVPPKPARKG